MNEITFSEEEQRRVDAFLSRLDKAIEAVAEAENISEYDCNNLAKDVVYGQNGNVFDPRRKIRYAKSRTNRYSDLIIGGLFCSEAFPVYGPDEEERLMRSVVREVIAAGDLSMMGGLLTYLSNHKDECQVNGMICDLRSAMNERLNLSGEQMSKHTTIMEVETLRVKQLIIEGEGHPHFPECLSLETSTNLYYFLSGQNPKGLRFIDGDKTPLADFNYLMGATSHYTTPGKPKPIWWLSNKQMLRELIKLAFAPLLENGTKLNSLAEFVPKCLVDEEGNPLILAKEDKRRIVFQELNVFQDFFAAYSRPINNT